MKASLFPNSAALVLSAMALGSLLMGQPYPRARADEPVYDLLSTGRVVPKSAAQTSRVVTLSVLSGNARFRSTFDEQLAEREILGVLPEFGSC